MGHKKKSDESVQCMCCESICESIEDVVGLVSFDGIFVFNKGDEDSFYTEYTWRNGQPVLGVGVCCIACVRKLVKGGKLDCYRDETIT